MALVYFRRRCQDRAPPPVSDRLSAVAALSCAALDAELVAFRVGHDDPPG